MKRKINMIVISVLCVCLLSACGSSFTKKDAKDYAEGIMQTMKGNPKKICKITGEKESEYNKTFQEIEDNYIETMKSEVNDESTNYEMTDAQINSFRDIFKDLISTFKYKIKSVKVDKNKNYKVEIEITTPAIPKKIESKFEEESENIQNEIIALPNAASMSENDVLSYCTDKMIEIMKNMVKDADNLSETKTFDLSIKKDKNGQYGIDDDEYSNIFMYSLFGEL